MRAFIYRSHPLTVSTVDCDQLVRAAALSEEGFCDLTYLGNKLKGWYDCNHYHT